MTSKQPPKRDGLSLGDFDIANYVEPQDESAFLAGTLKRQAKESLGMERVRRALFEHGRNGLTPPEVAGLVRLSEPTVRKHLERLCSIREAYVVMRQANLRLYYPNGEPLHGMGRARIEEGPYIIETVLARGPEERLFIHITEKRFSVLEGERTEGGVLVPLDSVNELIEEMRKLKERGAEIVSR